jgi:hypothetical protein
MAKKTKFGFVRIYAEDHVRIKTEIAKENRANDGNGFRASSATIVRAALRAYIECPECNLTLNKCNCNNISK